MESEEYTQLCKNVADAATMLLKALEALMTSHGDESRALDVKEAIAYTEGSVYDIGN